MKNIWIFRNGASTQEFESFPYAFRTMHAIAKTAVESSGSARIIQQLSIISPQKDVHGDFRKYNYTAATELAKASDLLDSNGQINSRVFKRKY